MDSSTIQYYAMTNRVWLCFLLSFDSILVIKMLYVNTPFLENLSLKNANFQNQHKQDFVSPYNH